MSSTAFLKFLRRSSIGLLIFAFGCSHYQAGLPSENSGDPKMSVLLDPIENLSDSPQLISPFSRQLRSGLLQSPMIELVDSEEAADVNLRVTLLSWNREALARDPLDTGRPLSYRVTLTASVEWIADSPPPWNSPNPRIFSASTSLYAQPSLIDAEFQATPAIMDNLSRLILEAIENPWQNKSDG